MRALLDRLARLAVADAWADQLNPAQLAALEYPERANRFSRAPSHVADYLGATRGTVSQTLKSLERKNLLTEVRSGSDKRRTSYTVTGLGAGILQRTQEIETVLDGMTKAQRTTLEDGLRGVLTGVLALRGGRSFGICQTCAHHQHNPEGAYCRLLGVRLSQEESQQICHEHAA